ncbi:MAG: type II/IV secretion system protein [Tissierellia bacterium]|nr:type II/IV secretion system protein [Tissierellia bacterium]
MNDSILSKLGLDKIEDLIKYEIDKSNYEIIQNEFLEKHSLIPIFHNDLEVFLIGYNDMDLNIISDIELITNLRPLFLKIPKELYETIKTQEENNNKRDSIFLELLNYDENDLDNTENLKVIVKYLNNLLEKAIKRCASDIHIDPFKSYIRVRLRVDGILNEIDRLDIGLLPIITVRIKILGQMDISEKRLPQDGRISFEYENREIDMRIASIPTVNGEKIVIRILDNNNKVKSLKDLGLYGDNLEKVKNLIKEPHGLILFCGPTGAGKSSSIYTILKEMNSERSNIITVEDPVEYKIEGINQIQTNSRIGLSFESALEHILRCDPSIISIGELRSKETAQTAIRASITGHLVLSTIHTNSAIAGIYRRLDMGIENYMISNGIIGIISQRLVRKLCPKCKVMSKIPKYYNGEKLFSYSAVGCKECSDGYKGRIGIFEVLVFSQKIKEAVNSNLSSDEIEAIAKCSGMNFINNEGLKLVREGITTIEELNSILTKEEI